jgi:hypothetical protein
MDERQRKFLVIQIINLWDRFWLSITYFFYHYVHSYSSILFIEKLQFFILSKNKITKSYFELLYKKNCPTHVFFTHQRPSYLAPFLYVDY